MEDQRFYRLPLIPVGAAASSLGISASLIRKYESEGLVLLGRSSSGARRLLAAADLERVFFYRLLIKELRYGYERLRRLLASQVACWEEMDCEPEARSNCPAFMSANQPCWTVHGTRCRLGQLKCRDCQVYWQSQDKLERLLLRQPSV